jgi:uncharacterized membrane protein
MADSFFKDEGEPKSDSNTDQPDSIKQEEIPTLPKDKTDISDDARLAALMSYVPFLCFVPFVNENLKDNQEARFHARQGVMLFLIEMVAVVFLIDDIAKFVFKAVLICAAAFSVAGVYFALQGKQFRLPLISDLLDKTKL